MKKKYEKPGLYVESFVLSQGVATPCGAAQDSTLGTPNYGTRETCGWNMGNEIIWVADPQCNEHVPADIPFDGVCYNNPGPGNAIFSIS